MVAQTAAKILADANHVPDRRPQHRRATMPAAFLYPFSIPRLIVHPTLESTRIP